MNHLDEGTIHAWLDDAVDSTQSGEIEAHIAQCATCSAAVAEARGLVAGASRILNALDDVQANVVPKRAPSVAPARRQWRAAPWVTGIAAALMLAIGLTQVDRKGTQDNVFLADKSPVTSTSESIADTATSRTVAASAPAEPRKQTLKAESAPPVVARSKAVATPPKERRDLARSERQIAITEDVRRVGSASDAVQTTRLRSAAGAGAAQTSPTQAAPAAPSQSVQNAPAQQKLDQAVVTAAPEAMKSAVSASDVGADAKAQVERLAGCYRVARETRQIPAGSVAGAVGRPAARARAADRPSAARYSPLAPPEIIQLDSVQKPLGYVVRAGATDSTTIGWWYRVGADTADVRLASGIAFKLLGKNRMDCPER